MAAGRGGRRWRALVLWAAAVLIVAVGAGLALMLPARRPLLDARDELQVARTALVGGDLGKAGDAFARAQLAFGRASDRIGNPLTRLAGLIPLLGRTPDAVADMVNAGALVTRAGRLLAAGLEGLPGGLSAFAPKDGVIQLDAFEELAPPLAEARDLVLEADRFVRGAPQTWIPDPVSQPLFLFQEQIGQARQAIVAAESLARTLPSFLGVDGPRRYFVAAQNPAELRGTGGLIGSYAILVADDGRLKLGRFGPTEGLPNAIGDVEQPNPDYEALYIRWGGAGYWANLNRTPDFPSAATSIERLYEEVTGVRLDGVIAADPEAFAELLEATGPATIPGLGVTLDAGNVVPFVTNEAYVRYSDTVERKRVLGEVAGRVLARFLNSGASQDPITASRGLVEAAVGGHLRFHSTDPTVQATFDRARLSGRLTNPEGDYLGVVVNNNGGNKIDFYLERSIRYEVRLEPGGLAEAQAVIDLGNEAPAEGLPPYIIGPFPLKDADPGENVAVMQTYCAGSCQIQGFEVDGKPGKGELATELGHPLVMSNVRIPSGGAQHLTYRWSVPDAWSGDLGAGTYRLTFRGQVAIRPGTLELDVRVPDGMRILRTSPGIRVVGGHAVWQGPAKDLSTFEIEFYRPLFSW